MNDAEYEIFLTSAHWQERCEQVQALYRTCVICNAVDGLRVHCRDYRNMRTADLHTDLTLLCGDCFFKYARNINKPQRRVKKKKKVVERRNAVMETAQEFLWQETQKQFNETKAESDQKHLTRPARRKVAFVPALFDSKENNEL